MGARVMVDVFSGRPNPIITLSDAATAKWLSAVRRPKGGAAREAALPLPDVPTLGYRGIVVVQEGRLQAGLPRTFRVANGDVFAGDASWATTTEFEESITDVDGPLKRLKLGRKVHRHFAESLATFKETRGRWKGHGRGHGHGHHVNDHHHGVTAPVTKVPKACDCGPLYEPAWWSDGSGDITIPCVQYYNNCYNYACNYRTDTYAQPGWPAGLHPAWQCAATTAAAVADGLIDSPTADNKCPPEGHLVALAICPTIDFHWYRKDRSGMWSHKPGGSEATDLDNAFHPIPDPRTANRDLYIFLCTFMVVMHGHIKIDWELP